jgi:hypothetical protein
VLINPEFQFPYRRWVEESYRTLHDIELPYLSALVTAHGYIPDFLTPTPLTNRADIEADFEDLLATPDETIRKGILELIEADGDSEMRRVFLAHPRESVRCLVEELRFYWQRTIAHYWSRMMSTLESDLLYRERTLALDGPAPLFDSLHSSVTLRHEQIDIQPICQHLHQDVEFTLNGEGIQLVPVVFRGCGRMFQFETDFQPMLAYGVRGGGLWYQKAASPQQSLELALGTGRARVLQVLNTPATTGEVAFRARISASNASQHLSRLYRAGLVEPRRSGKRVYYHLTSRGAELLALFARTD